MTNAFSNMGPEEWPNLSLEDQFDVIDIVATVEEMKIDRPSPIQDTPS